MKDLLTRGYSAAKKLGIKENDMHSIIRLTNYYIDNVIYGTILWYNDNDNDGVLTYAVVMNNGYVMKYEAWEDVEYEIYYKEKIRQFLVAQIMDKPCSTVSAKIRKSKNRNPKCIKNKPVRITTDEMVYPIMKPMDINISRLEEETSSKQKG